MWFWLLLIVGLGVRVALLVWYEPVRYPDTGTYFDAAKDLIEGGLSHSEGRRTPGYPAVVALAGMRPWALFALQAAGGLITSALLYYIGLALTGRSWVGFAAGIAYDLNLQQLFVEGALLSEAISTLTVVGTVAMTVHVLRRVQGGMVPAPLALLLGVTSGIAILVRPQFVFLLALTPLFVAFGAGRRSLLNTPAMATGALVAVPAFAMVLTWMGFVYAETGQFALTTQAGFSLVNHSVGFVEFAPERYATIRDILVKDRAAMLAEHGQYGNTGWLAFPEMARATGMNIPELSRMLQRMSVELFVAHPLRYAISVGHSWIDFWTVPILWQPDNLRAESMVPTLKAIWWAEHKLLRLSNLAFILLVVTVIVSSRARRALAWRLDMTSIVALILMSSLVQALADYGASSRYAVTIQALVPLALVIAYLRWRDRVHPAAAHNAGGDGGVSAVPTMRMAIR